MTKNLIHGNQKLPVIWVRVASGTCSADHIWGTKLVRTKMSTIGLTAGGSGNESASMLPCHAQVRASRKHHQETLRDGSPKNQTCMYFFLLLISKEDIWNNAGNQPFEGRFFLLWKSNTVRLPTLFKISWKSCSVRVSKRWVWFIFRWIINKNKH